MDFTSLLGNPAVITTGTMLVGKFAKEHPKFENDFIPVLTFVAALVGFTLSPVTGQVASAAGGDHTLVAAALAGVTTVGTGLLHAIAKRVPFLNSVGSLLSSAAGLGSNSE